MWLSMSAMLGLNMYITGNTEVERELTYPIKYIHGYVVLFVYFSYIHVINVSMFIWGLLHWHWVNRVVIPVVVQ